MSEGESAKPEVVAKRTRTDSYRQAFRVAQQENDSYWQEKHQIPNRLYHYTTLKGIVGITSNLAMWASDARYMNDASEFEYATEVIDGIVADSLQAVTDERLKPVLPQRRGVANWFEYGVRPFVACFCEDADLLSQWRGYGRGDAPASLGFDLLKLSKVSGLPSRTFLRKVVYDEEEQKRIVCAVVQVWIQTAQSLLEQGVEPKKLFPYPAIWALQEAVSEQYLCFKNPAFCQEREWRLIKLVDVGEELALLRDQRSEAMFRQLREMTEGFGVQLPPSLPPRILSDAEGIEIKFRESPMGLVPYVELPLAGPPGLFQGGLPIMEVIQGPTAHPELALESLSTYLSSRGYRDFQTEIRISRIPLRP